MSISGAGGNKSRQLIAYIGPWTALNDDFGPYALPTGFSKVQFSTEGDGAGYSISIYDGVSTAIDTAIQGVYNPDLGIRLSPMPPPPVPTAAYGAALAIPETSWSLVIGPSSQAGTGPEANPLIPNGVNASKLLASYPIYYCRAKVTAVAGATGRIKVWAVAIP
jgi:hypothetical protein